MIFTRRSLSPGALGDARHSGRATRPWRALSSFARGRGERMAKMRALVKAEKAVGIWMQEAEVPEVGPNDVKIRIKKTAICGTDIHIYNWDDWAKKTIPVPMHVGHEYVGEVVAVGSHARGFSEGDRVSGE